MKAADFPIVSLVYVVMSSLVFFVFRKIDDVAAYSQIAGLLTAIPLTVWLYQSRNEAPASSKTKLSIGFLLAALIIIQGLVFQYFFQWMEYPDIEIGIPAVGSVIGSSYLWTMYTRSFGVAKKN